LLADDVRIVDVFGRVKGEQRVVVNVIVEPPGPERETGDHLAAIHRLAGAGDSAGFDEVNDAVGNHLGVDAEVFFMREETEQGLRDASDAKSSSRPPPAPRCIRQFDASRPSRRAAGTSRIAAPEGTSTSIS